MSNKVRNIEAALIYRPVITGQVGGVDADIEAAVYGIIFAIFGVDLLPPCNPATLWHNRK